MRAGGRAGGGGSSSASVLSYGLEPAWLFGGLRHWALPAWLSGPPAGQQGGGR
jgi:hypothetical protein